MKVNDLTQAALPETFITIIHLGGKYDPVQITTDIEGRACAQEVREGTYRVDVWKPGFLHASFQPVSVHPDAPGWLVATLPFGDILALEGEIRETATVSGTLIDSDGPVSLGHICMLPAKASNPLVCAYTDELGEYVLSVPPGEYTVEITQHKGRKAKPIALSLPSPARYRNKLSVTWINE